MINFGKIVKNENFELFWENFELFLGKLWTFWENFELFGKILNFLGKFWTFWENFELFGKILIFLGIFCLQNFFYIFCQVYLQIFRWWNLRMSGHWTHWMSVWVNVGHVVVWNWRHFWRCLLLVFYDFQIKLVSLFLAHTTKFHS